MLPPFEGSAKQKIVREDTHWVRSGKKLENIEDLCTMANEIATTSKTRRACIAIGDVLIREDTWTFSIGSKEISFGPATAAIFRELLMNANRAVSNEKLIKSVAEDFDSSDVCKHIYVLRNKLGRENEGRIRSVRGVGYMYVTYENAQGDTKSLATSGLLTAVGTQLLTSNASQRSE